MTDESIPAPLSRKIPRAKKIFFAAVVLVIACVLALVAAEIFLRAVPIPGIEYHSFYYDELTGGLLYPHSKVIYRSARGETIEREVNGWGFLDVEHTIEPPPATFRIGFFGDSYTEAKQVAFDSTFFRIVHNDLNRLLSAGAFDPGNGREPIDSVETLAFGIAGRSTVQSYLECSRWMDLADLDHVVYVFCENDVSDQIRELKGSSAIPYAFIEGDSFRVDNTFRELNRRKKSPFFRFWQRFKASSLVFSTLETRLKLLKRHGLKIKTAPEDRFMEAAPAADGRPTTGTSPSTWPSDSLLAYGETLAERVMDKWHAEVKRAGREFSIVYVPKERLLGIPVEEQDSWAGWLCAYCKSRGITLVDPSAALFSHRERGEEVYYDHFTNAGHRAVAEALIESFAGK